MTKKRTCHLGIMMGSAVMYVQLVQDKLGSTSSQLNNVFGANFLSSSYNCFCYVSEYCFSYLELSQYWRRQGLSRFLGLPCNLSSAAHFANKMYCEQLNYFTRLLQFNAIIQLLLACFSHSISHETKTKIKLRGSVMLELK